MIWIWDWWISQDDSWRGWWKHRGGLERDLKNCDLLSFCLETPKTIGMKCHGVCFYRKKIIQKMNREFSTQEVGVNFESLPPLVWVVVGTVHRRGFMVFHARLKTIHETPWKSEATGDIGKSLQICGQPGLGESAVLCLGEGGYFIIFFAYEDWNLNTRNQMDEQNPANQLC